MSPPDLPPEDEYLCVGICMPEPDSGYCLGCGRPPIPVSTGGQPDAFEALCAEHDETGTPGAPVPDSAASSEPSTTP